MSRLGHLANIGGLAILGRRIFLPSSVVGRLEEMGDSQGLLKWLFTHGDDVEGFVCERYDG
jgi:hypothetical protein